MSSTRYRSEIDTMYDNYWSDRVRGTLPRVSVPVSHDNPEIFYTTSQRHAPAEESVVCSSCGKPCKQHALPGFYVSILLPCEHNFCTRCSIFKLTTSDICVEPGCSGAIPHHTKQLLTTQHRSWAIQQALECCNDHDYSPLIWHGVLKDIMPMYDIAGHFLVNKASATSAVKTGSLAYIDMAVFRPHLVGFANLLPAMRHAEGESYDGDRERQWRYIIMAIDDFLAGQVYRTVPASLIPSCALTHVDKWLKQRGGLLGWSASGEHEVDFALLLDFVVEACQNDYYKNHSWRRKSAGLYKRAVSKMKGTKAINIIGRHSDFSSWGTRHGKGIAQSSIFIDREKRGGTRNNGNT